MANRESSKREIVKLQCWVSGALIAILAVILTIFYIQDCQREWRIREEQTAHRLELAYELVSRDLKRVLADVIYVANQKEIRQFDIAQPGNRQTVESEFSNLLESKGTFQQVRLIDRQGREAARVELVDDEIHVVPPDQLQDKSDRYYVQDSLRLVPGQIFVSEFDLNQERGEVERPLNPVIRFVTPVENDDGQNRYLLVANYRGAALLQELSNISLPGQTVLIRADGQYLLAPRNRDAWGWLLGHDASFATEFPKSWQHEKSSQLEFVPGEGAFAYRRLSLTQEGIGNPATAEDPADLLLVSRIPPDEVFENSKQLLRRLLIFSAAILVPILLLTRFWAVASIRRKQQNSLIQQSESRLRELSSRLVRIQEDERRAISREIHDQLGQQVTAINLDLKLLKQNLETVANGVTPQLERSISVSEELLESLHDFASRIRPVELDDLGLHDAIESHLQEFEQRTGIAFTFSCPVKDVEISAVVAENVFRLVQESLNNVLKHANATRVDVSIETTESNAKKALNVLIQDNGDGVETMPNALSTDNGSIEGSARLGILGMRERVELLSGTLEWSSQPDQGTQVFVTVPLVDYPPLHPDATKEPR